MGKPKHPRCLPVLATWAVLVACTGSSERGADGKATSSPSAATSVVATSPAPGPSAEPMPTRSTTPSDGSSEPQAPSPTPAASDGPAPAMVPVSAGGGPPSPSDAAGASAGGSPSQMPETATAGGGSAPVGGSPATGGMPGSAGMGGTAGAGNASAAGGTAGTGGTAGAAAGNCSGPVGTISGELATGVAFVDTDGERVNAHGGGIIRHDGVFYLHGEYFLSTTTDNDFHGFAMYSSKDLATWTNEGIILPTQPSGELGPKRKGERPHIIECPATGEFVLFAHAASEDYQSDKEVVYATSPTVNGQYTYQGPLQNAGGQLIVHSDMSAFADDSGAYVVTESGHVFPLADDCHSWLSDQTFGAVNGDSGGIEAPTIFEADGTYYWLGSYKTGWRANNNFYSTAPAMTGPWTYRGYFAPVSDPNDNISDERTWLSQVTWVQPVAGCEGTVYVYLGDHWDGTESTAAPGRHNDLATYVVQPLVLDGTSISLPVYRTTWQLDVGAGSWSE